MIVDSLENSALYESLHPRFKSVFSFLRQHNLDALPAGRTDLEGDALFALAQEYETKPISEGKLEAHKAYIDIQFIVSGEEFIGYAPLKNQPVAKAFDPAKDIGFYDGEAWFTLYRKGMFAILFPHDAHLPGRHTDKPTQVKKIVFKIAVSP